MFDSVTFFRQNEYVENGHFSVTANLFTLKNVLENVGPFNNALRSGWAWNGIIEFISMVTLVYAEDITVEHPARYQLKQTCKKFKERLVE